MDTFAKEQEWGGVRLEAACGVIECKTDEVTEPLRSAIKGAVKAIADLYANGDISRVGLSVYEDGAKAYVDGKLVDMGKLSYLGYKGIV